MIYEYSWINGSLVAGTPGLLDELSHLYSTQYGVWGQHAQKPPGSRIGLSPSRLRSWLTDNSMVALARHNGVLIGYAVVVRAKIRGQRVISWVTQFVVHEDHRRRGVGKALLFSIWGFSNHYAWGLLTANPYAVRALEKATRRRVSPRAVSERKDTLFRTAVKNVPYVDENTAVTANTSTAKINTRFFIDHSELPAMLENATTPEAPWVLGDLEDGWEWMGFTFLHQEMIGLSSDEIEMMLGASDQAVKVALSRMALDRKHRWMQHTRSEAERILQYCHLRSGDSVLDVGCGNGRHSLQLAEMGVVATGVDYLENLIQSARNQASSRGVDDRVEFHVEDCRRLRLEKQFDAVISLYDVVGTYASENDNTRLVQTIREHLKPGGMALLSVMNYELTEIQAKHFFSLSEDPDALLRLAPSRTMEQTGNIFNPEYYLIEKNTKVIYRKEQFENGSELPIELIVRDRRFRREEIEAMCNMAGLNVAWSRFVSLGNWADELDPHDPRAKEILVLCRRAE